MRGIAPAKKMAAQRGLEISGLPGDARSFARAISSSANTSF
jgi:hypothetical protein